MPVFFDTHAHLDYPEYEKDFSEVLARAQNAGITKIISIGTSLDSSRRAMRSRKNFLRFTPPSAGIRPRR